MTQSAAAPLDRRDMVDKMNASIIVDRATTAVVTVDCQRGNLDPRIASLPVPAAECTRVIAGLNRLIAIARSASIPIIHVDTVYEPPLLATHPFEQAMQATKLSFTPHSRSDFARHKSPGSVEAELVPDLDVRPEDYRVSSKRTFDSFYGTQLDVLLRAMKTDTLLIGGCNTNTCILGTVFGAYSRGLRAIVLSDCVASAYGEDLHQFALSNIQRRLGWVMDLDTLQNKLVPTPTLAAIRA